VCWCEGRKNRRSLVMGRRFYAGNAELLLPAREMRISFKAYQRLASTTEFIGRIGSRPFLY
jgi:hypothetical protein